LRFCLDALAGAALPSIRIEAVQPEPCRSFRPILRNEALFDQFLQSPERDFEGMIAPSLAHAYTSAVGLAHGDVIACQSAGIPFPLDVAPFGAGKLLEDIQGELLHMIPLSFGGELKGYGALLIEFKLS
jgi:hypothetical protein